MKKIILNNKNRIIQEDEHEKAFQEFMQEILDLTLKISKYKTKVINHQNGYYDLIVYHGDGYKTQYKDIDRNIKI